MGPKKVTKKDAKLESSKLMLTRSSAEVDEEVEERVGDEKQEVAEYSNLTVTQLRDIIRERGLSSPRPKTR